MVFWDRFYREVFGSDADGIAEQLEQHRYVVNKDWETMFDGILHECAERPAQGPDATSPPSCAGSPSTWS